LYLDNETAYKGEIIDFWSYFGLSFFCFWRRFTSLLLDEASEELVAEELAAEESRLRYPHFRLVDFVCASLPCLPSLPCNKIQTSKDFQTFNCFV